MYITIFRCGGTARNYVGSIRWACVTFRMSLSWDTERVTQALRGVEKKVLRILGPKSSQKTLLTQELVGQVCDLGLVAVSEEFVVLTLLSWEFLLRVQSEGIGLQYGSQQLIFDLAPSRHSSICMVGNVLVVRFTRRKHRPSGSTLKRVCRCATVGRQACAVCTFRQWAEARKPRVGDRVFGGSASQYLHSLRRMLTMLLHPQAAAFTLKAFRAGRASQMTRDGASWQEIQAAGEWRGLSSLPYISKTAIDDYASLMMSIEASSEDEEK